MDRNDRLLAKRARERALGTERRNARRYKDPRTVPGYEAINLNPHGMDERARAVPTVRDREWVDAIENTGGRGKTIEYVACGKCKPGTKCHHGRTRLRTMAPSRKVYDGPTHWVSPVDERCGHGDRADNASAPEPERALLSYTDMVQHGLVVEV